jgi:hypothetical protein
LLTQFWDREVHVGGSEDSWTLHGLWSVALITTSLNIANKASPTGPTSATALTMRSAT